GGCVARGSAEGRAEDDEKASAGTDRMLAEALAVADVERPHRGRDPESGASRVPHRAFAAQAEELAQPEVAPPLPDAAPIREHEPARLAGKRKQPFERTREHAIARTDHPVRVPAERALAADLE